MTRRARLRHLVSTAAGDEGKAARGERRRRRVVVWAGAVVAVLLAAGLFSRFSIDDTLSRDEAIYAYGGQQLAEGVPPYVSIFDAKTPLSVVIPGAGVALGRAVGVNDVYAMRALFFLFACLTVVAVYLLAAWLFASPLLGLLSAAAFASFRGFALDALTGPDAKTPGVFFAVLSMALVVRRRYVWGAFAGSLAFLVWQPLAVYAAGAVVVAALTAQPGRRLGRAGLTLAGAALPVAATAIWLWLAGALDDFVDGAFVFPVTHLERTENPLLQRVEHIAAIVDRHYGWSGVLFWVGLAFLVGLLVLRLVRGRSDLRALVRNDALVNVVALSFLPVAAFTMLDFQGYPDLYPLLPYAALGLGGALALASARAPRGRPQLVAAALAGVAVVALSVASWVTYAEKSGRDEVLHQQRRTAARIGRLVEPDGTVQALGNSWPLVLLERRNPTPYIYLSAGVDEWVVDHTPGGFEGWTEEIRAEDPEVILLGGPWNTDYGDRMEAWLEEEYAHVRTARLRIFLQPAVRERAVREGIFRPERIIDAGSR